MLEEKLYQTFGENLKRISDIADVICGPFGSAIKIQTIKIQVYHLSG